MLTRILTGLVGVPIVVWLLHSGGMLFNAAIFVLVPADMICGSTDPTEKSAVSAAKSI